MIGTLAWGAAILGAFTLAVVVFLTKAQMTGRGAALAGWLGLAVYVVLLAVSAWLGWISDGAFGVIVLVGGGALLGGAVGIALGGQRDD